MPRCAIRYHRRHHQYSFINVPVVFYYISQYALYLHFILCELKSSVCLKQTRKKEVRAYIKTITEIIFDID